MVAHQALGIPELLETILLNLGPRELLLSQRTCRTFRDTVQCSIRLKRKLFVEPDWTLEGQQFQPYSISNFPGSRPENNRLLLRAFPGCYPTIRLDMHPTNSRVGRGGAQQTSFTFGGRRDSEQWTWDVCISFPAVRIPDLNPAVLYPEASWRKMYLSQPPCTSLYLTRRWQRSSRPAMIRESGITMGDFFDEATKPAPGCDNRKWHQSFISSDRAWHFQGNLQCSSYEE